MPAGKLFGFEIESIDMLAVSLSAALTMIAILAVTATFMSPRKRRMDATDDPEQIENIFRIQKIKWRLKQQQRFAKFASIADTTSTVSQIIIGVLLVSKYADNQLKELSLDLGIIVLISSLLTIAFKPEAKSQASKQRAAMLKYLLTDAENSAQDFREKRLTENQISELRREISERLTSIDAWGLPRAPH